MSIFTSKAQRAAEARKAAEKATRDATTAQLKRAFLFNAANAVPLTDEDREAEMYMAFYGAQAAQRS